MLNTATRRTDIGWGSYRDRPPRWSPAGVGPVISFVTKVFGNDLATEIKWLPELSVDKRLKGDTIWFKMGMVF